MVKVKITNCNKCYYDDENNTIYIRKSLFNENFDEIERILEHEINHAIFRKSRNINILYDFYENLKLTISKLIMKFHK